MALPLPPKLRATIPQEPRPPRGHDAHDQKRQQFCEQEKSTQGIFRRREKTGKQNCFFHVFLLSNSAFSGRKNYIKKKSQPQQNSLQSRKTCRSEQKTLPFGAKKLALERKKTVFGAEKLPPNHQKMFIEQKSLPCRTEIIGFGAEKLALGRKKKSVFEAEKLAPKHKNSL